MAADLNPAQNEAVEHDLGPLLVLAGAGSGKTRVVTKRVARLIERGVGARSILAMTFTNKAAAEMHSRVTDLVGKAVAKNLTVSTFHRFGLTVLGAETRALGLRGNTIAIFDQADSAGVVREILREIRPGKAFDIAAILGRISAAKNAFVDPEEWADKQRKSRGLDDYDEIAMLVYPRYMAQLRAFQAFDFDDLIGEVVRLWKRRPEVLDRWATRYRYLIVDEYQDTNHGQLELVRLLGGVHRNVCVVGDDDQSIYAWRGADVRNILEFESHFHGAKVVKLEENYRSSRAILAVANVVLQRAGAKRHKKTIVPTRDLGERVQVVTASDPEIEASFVAAEIQALTEGDPEKGAQAARVRPRDVAVLYRSNMQAPEIESALKERQLPYRMIGGTQFYERKEVKDLIAYLRVAIRPDDEMSLRRIINYPSRGIGEVAFNKIVAHATARDMSLWSVVQKPHAVQDLAPPAVAGCRDLVRLIDQTRARFDRNEPSAKVARGLVEDIGLKTDIQAASTSNAIAARRWANVEGILGVFGRRDDKGKGDRASFADFLRVLALREETEEADKTEVITLTTMHGAKGLEFSVVFVVGLEEGLMPHTRSMTERATDVPTGHDGTHSLDEERRLFYVAVTRARDRLYLCKTRQRGAQGKIMPRTASRFLLEIPEDLYDAREESAKVAPAAKVAQQGAASVLAALSGLTAIGEGPPPVRRRS